VVAEFLRDHPKVDKVHYLPFSRSQGSPEGKVFAAQSTGAGSTFSFDIKGGQKAAFAFLNALQVFKLGGQPRRHGIAGQPAGLDDAFRRAEVEVRERIGVWRGYHPHLDWPGAP
jgi:methionine-gamma-lyase